MDKSLELGMLANETAAGNGDGAADGLERHCAEEVCGVAEAAVALVVAQLAVFLCTARASGLAVEMPEIAFHSACDCDFAAFVVNGCVGQGGFVDDGVALDARCDGLAQASALDEKGACGVGVVVATACPGLIEECLAFEVAVELVASLDHNVLHCVVDKLLCELAEFGVLFHSLNVV